jgi:uncharacterized protein (DUF433 family)
MDTQQTISDALAETLRNRSIVHTDPDIMSGVPVFIGTRVPLQTLFDYLKDEDGLNEFSEDFPHLKIPAIQVLESIARVMLYRGGVLNARFAG